MRCRSQIDGEPFKKPFFDDVRKKNWPNINITGKVFIVCSGSLPQSIGRGRLSREGALDVRVSRERRDKGFAEKQRKIQKQKQQFSIILNGEFSFFGRVKTNFGRGGITSKLASQ